VNFHLHPYVKYSGHSGDMHEARICFTTFCKEINTDFHENSANVAAGDNRPRRDVRIDVVCTYGVLLSFRTARLKCLRRCVD